MGITPITAIAADVRGAVKLKSTFMNWIIPEKPKRY
jgi:hypothetical protein